MEKSLERKTQVDTMRLVSKYPEWIQLDMQLQYPQVQKLNMKDIRNCLNSNLVTPYHVLDYILATLNMPNNCKVQWENYYSKGTIKIVVEDTIEYVYKVLHDCIVLKSKQWDNYEVSQYYDRVRIQKKEVTPHKLPKWMKADKEETCSEISIKAIENEWSPEEMVVLQSLLESIADTQWDSWLCVAIAKTVKQVLGHECKVEYIAQDRHVAMYKKGEYADYTNKKRYQWKDKENWELYNPVTGNITQCTQGNTSTKLYVLDIPIQEDTSIVRQDMETIIEKVESTSSLEFQMSKPLYYMRLQENVVNDLTLHELLNATGMLLPEILAVVRQIGLQEGIHLWKQDGNVYVQDKYANQIRITTDKWYNDDILIEENGMEVRYEQVENNLFRRISCRATLQDGSVYQETIDYDTIVYQKGDYSLTVEEFELNETIRKALLDWVETENVMQNCSFLWKHPDIVKEHIMTVEYTNEEDKDIQKVTIDDLGELKQIGWISSEKGVWYVLKMYYNTFWSIHFADDYVLTSEGSYMYNEEKIRQFSEEETQHIFTTYILPIVEPFLN